VSAPLDPSPLLAGPSGITCTDCGATLPSGARPDGHAPLCPTAARWRAYEVLGGSAAVLARQLYQEAGSAETARAVAALLREVAAGVEARAGRAPGPLRVYVAGGAAERLTVARPWIRALQGAGVCVTHDWTVDPGWDDPAPSPAALAAAAAADLDGVRRCDVLWLLCPAAKSEGSAAELGAALALGRRVVVSGGWGEMGRIFPGLAGECYAHHEEAFRGVLRAAAAVCGMVAP